VSRLAQLPGWLLTVVWILVPVVAISALVFALTGDDDGAADDGPPRIGSSGVDVQTAALQERRERAGIDDCAGLPTSDPADDGLPALSLPCLGGAGDVDLSTLEGPLVLNVWAQTCGPCRDEMPLFQQLHRAAEGLTVLGVDYLDLQPHLAIDFAERAGVTYPSVADVDDQLRSPLRLQSLPTTLFVDADGRVVATEVKEFTSYDELAATVERHLGVVG